MASMDMAQPVPSGPADDRAGAQQGWCALGVATALLVDLASNERASVLVKLREAMIAHAMPRVDDTLAVSFAVVAMALCLFAINPASGRVAAFVRGMLTVAILAVLLPYQPAPGTTEIRSTTSSTTSYRKTVDIAFDGDRTPMPGARLILRDAASGMALGEAALIDARSEIALTAPIGVYDLDIEAAGFERTRARVVVAGPKDAPATVDVRASSLPLALQQFFAPASAR